MKRMSFNTQHGFDFSEQKVDYISVSRDVQVTAADIPAIIASDHRPHTATVVVRPTETHYEKLYAKAFKILGALTPLKADCGRLCDGACCKGDDQTGMRLFPFEKTVLRVIDTGGERIAVCDGTCDRAERPLACRIFPFFPTVDEKGRVFVELDPRGTHICPLITHSDEVLFDKRFFRAVKRVGKLLTKDLACRKFLEDTTAEIDTYTAFLKK